MKVIGNLLHRLNKLEQTLHKYQKNDNSGFKTYEYKKMRSVELMICN